jgi:Holliday junction resolvase RusA-like endonuclease
MPKRSLKILPPPLSDEELRDYAITQYTADLRQAANNSITFRLYGPVVPKARPRCGVRRGKAIAYPDQKYDEWKEEAKRELGKIITLFPKYTYPLLQANVFFVFDGKHDRSCDGDNSEGAIEDALVQAGVLKDDNFLRLPSQAATLNYDKKRSPSTLIVLY